MILPSAYWLASQLGISSGNKSIEPRLTAKLSTGDENHVKFIFSFHTGLNNKGQYRVIYIQHWFYIKTLPMLIFIIGQMNY